LELAAEERRFLSASVKREENGTVRGAAPGRLGFGGIEKADSKASFGSSFYSLQSSKKRSRWTGEGKTHICVDRDGRRRKW
jgi:hypothetical protein